VTLRASGTSELTVSVAEPGPIVAMKLQSIMNRGSAKEGTDLLDIIRLSVDPATGPVLALSSLMLIHGFGPTPCGTPNGGSAIMPIDLFAACGTFQRAAMQNLTISISWANFSAMHWPQRAANPWLIQKCLEIAVCTGERH